MYIFSAIDTTPKRPVLNMHNVSTNEKAYVYSKKQKHRYNSFFGYTKHASVMFN